jgi:alpha-tubulin suppressor-like RCC1 family protein
VGWGYNNYGQTGNGTPTISACSCLESPAPVSGLSAVTQISGGEYHTLALLSDGSARAWGFNAYGQLGNGGISYSAAPVPVKGLQNVVAVSGGSEHSLALLSNGTVMAWGENEYGELGIGSSSGPEECSGAPCGRFPVPVPGLANVIAIAADYRYSLALLADGTVMAWGTDESGQLGDGVGIQSGCLCVDHPAPVPGISGAVAISAGYRSGSALLQDGAVKDWGDNYFGELGNGTATTTTTCRCLGPVSVSGLSGVKSIAMGSFHGMALLSDGTVRAWGYNAHGQLGIGSATGPEECVESKPCSRTPVSVAALSGVQAISAAAEHNLALLGDGTAHAWGSNGLGELGDGTKSERNAPVPVSGLNGASAIEAGEMNGFALLGPAQTLNISLAGASTGMVGGPGILCSPSCAGRFPQGQVEILRAAPAAGSGFAGFSGPCTGIGICQVRMDQDQGVTATFGPPKGTAITRAKIKSPKKRATFSFTAPGAITGFQCELIKPKPKHHKSGSKKELKHGGGHRRPKPRFAKCGVPKAYKHLRPGRYTFKVRGLDILGADATPATKKFKIKPPQHPR